MLLVSKTVFDVVMRISQYRRWRRHHTAPTAMDTGTVDTGTDTVADTDTGTAVLHCTGCMGGTVVLYFGFIML